MFQHAVALTQAPAVEGDFASANARMSQNAIPGGLVAGAAGVTVGRFGWIDSTDLILNNFSTAGVIPDGFIHREQQALITVYLAEASNLVPAGYGVVAHSQGDFWAKMKTVAVKGQRAFANLGDGSVGSAAAGAILAGFVGTATFATSVMTVASVGSGAVAVGDIVTSAGVAAGTTVLSQLTGTPGGVGTYQLSTTPGTITPAQAITTTSYIETRWKIDTAAQIGELAKISSWG